ncbi:MAG: right-handed parallel beta-helix repeat-containing protein, partial [Acidobacteria bacterium]|nr:right-handed parallel beta-helix repeat-containing protein [Acidobacteriota bacterium]
MPGDYTRVTFNSLRDYLGVLMQQGRVLLDADFNELVEMLDRRFRAETIDIIGHCKVPRETPHGFRIQISGSTITIGRGRLYADGLLAENHGTGEREFDRVLAEERGTMPVAYADQPYLPGAATLAPLPSRGGPHLVYLDVWQREVTHVEEPTLVEKAVGVDTATRLQTVWQVRVLADVPQGTTCATPDAQIPRWPEIIRPSAGRLTTSPVGVATDLDPCPVPAAGGFRGIENRLYRVEIHQGGPLSQASFKWSRDNASIATRVTGISASRDVLT